MDDDLTARLTLRVGINTDGESESNDRESITWNGGVVDILGQLASFGKPTILAQFGTSLDNSRWMENENISAIIWGGYPGQDGGTALMNIITGVTAPAGRLPVTVYPGHYVDDVDMTDMGLRPNESSGNPGRKLKARPSTAVDANNWIGTYRWYPDPVFPFGYGVHYTKFTASIGDPTLAIASSSGNNSSEQGPSSYDIASLMSVCNMSTPLDLCSFATVPVSVSNAGSVSSDYVTLGFITGAHGPEPYPIKTLVAYERLFNISAGESQTAQLNLTLGSLSRYDEMGNQKLYPGDHALQIDTVGVLAVWNFTLTGEESMLDEWPQMPSDHGAKYRKTQAEDMREL